MAEFTKKELRICERSAAGVAAGGLLAALITLIPHDPEGFWHEWITGLHGAGWVLFGFGLVFLALASAHLRTRFFVSSERIDAQAAGARVGLAAAGVLIAMVVLLNVIPFTSRDRLPGNPDARAEVLRREGAVRALVVFGLLATGGVIASFPVRQFLRQ